MPESANRSGRLASASPQSAAGAAQEIDEELMFHDRSLVEENIAKGMSSDDAWVNA